MRIFAAGVVVFFTFSVMPGRAWAIEEPDLSQWAKGPPIKAQFPADRLLSSAGGKTGRGLTAALEMMAGGGARRFYVYSDYKARTNRFSPTGFMGDVGDVRVNENTRTDFHSGTSSIRMAYAAKTNGGANWAGVFWQNPAHNWGGVDGRYDLTGARKLTFWARGEKGGERIEYFKVGGLGGKFADSDQVVLGPVLLSSQWRQYTIWLKGADLSAISGGFCWAAVKDYNPKGMVFYLDDIAFEFGPARTKWEGAAGA